MMAAIEMLRPPHRPVPFRQQGPEHFAQERPVLFSAEEIDTRFDEIADQLAIDYGLNTPNIFALAEGAIPTAQLLAKKLGERKMHPQIITIKVKTRINGIEESDSSSHVSISHMPNQLDFDRSRPALKIDDVLESGKTLHAVDAMLDNYHELLSQDPSRGPRIEPKTLVLLRKVIEKRKFPVEADYVGWDIPYEHHWVEGFGMDTDEMGRENPNIIVRNDLQKAMMLKDLHRKLSGLRDGK